MMTNIFKLQCAMEEAGFHIKGTINSYSEKFQRFKSLLAPNKGYDLFVKLLEGGAVFGDWHNRDNWITWWEESYINLSLEEKYERQSQIDRAKQKDLILKKFSRERAIELWNHSSLKEASQNHPYIKFKKIIPYYARQCRSWIVLPICDIDRDIQSLQFISKDCKRKRFKHGASFKNGMMFLAEKIFADSTISICEGWATACSIYETIGDPVICAFNADNLLNVALSLRRKYIHARIKICADNDQWGKKNIGLTIGREAARLTGGTFHYPVFNLEKLKIGQKPTDFNDLFSMEGIEEVEHQLSIIRK